MAERKRNLAAHAAYKAHQRKFRPTQVWDANRKEWQHYASMALDSIYTS